MTEREGGTRHRAKVYCLNDEGQWDDRGTGHAAVQYLPADETAFIVLVSEEDGGNIVRARVHSEDIYQRQQETILSWNEPDTGIDYALSFQEPDGCTELWEQICSLQGRSTDEPRGEAPADAQQPSAFAQQHADADALMGGGDQLPTLPAAELRNLAAIAELLAEVPLMRRARLAETLLQRDYIPQLVQLFTMAEDLEGTEDLHRLFNIFKAIVMLNNTNIYEVLLRDDMLMGVVGALEYDPELRCHQVRHREFLREKARFKQVVSFSDEAVMRKIHQNFYLGFLKDVVLPRALDDNTFAALNQLQFFNNVQIISALTNDVQFLEGLREKLMEEGATAEQLLEALKLLQELCAVTKTLQLYHRSAFYRKVVEHGYFVPLAGFLSRPEPALRLAAIDVLLSSTLHDPSLLRSHVLQQRPDGLMLRALLRVLTSDEASGEKPQITEVLRALLDPESMEGREQDDFLNLFYECYVHELALPVAGPVASGTGPMLNGTSSTLAGGASAPAAAAPAPSAVGAPAKNASHDGAQSKAGGGHDDAEGVLTARQHVCELLCFCVSKHSYRIKYFILRNNILFKVLKLASSKDKCLVLAALRFFRTCIGLKDEFYNRYIIKNRCFEPVITQLYANKSRDNLLHSAILELFDFIRRENIKSLVAHLAETYKDRLAALTHVDIFKGLLIRHEQNEDFRQMGGGGGGAMATSASAVAAAVGGLASGARRAESVFGRRAFPDEDDDSAYFNASDDEDDDDSGGTPGASSPDQGDDGPLVYINRGDRVVEVSAGRVGTVSARLKDSFQVLFPEVGEVTLLPHEIQLATTKPATADGDSAASTQAGVAWSAEGHPSRRPRLAPPGGVGPGCGPGCGGGSASSSSSSSNGRGSSDGGGVGSGLAGGTALGGGSRLSDGEPDWGMHRSLVHDPLAGGGAAAGGAGGGTATGNAAGAEVDIEMGIDRRDRAHLPGAGGEGAAGQGVGGGAPSTSGRGPEEEDKENVQRSSRADGPADGRPEAPRTEGASSVAAEAGAPTPSFPASSDAPSHVLPPSATSRLASSSDGVDDTEEERLPASAEDGGSKRQRVDGGPAEV